MALRASVLMVCLLLFFAVVAPVTGTAGVNINLNISAPLPLLRLPAPPPLVPIPGTYAYFAPDVNVDIVFYHGYWYRPDGGRWYRSSDYNGPWRHMDRGRVPGVLLGLPPDFRHRPREYQPVPYGQVKKNWRNWERDRYWDRHEGGRERRDRDHERREYERGHDRDRGEGHGHGRGRGHDKRDDD